MSLHIDVSECDKPFTDNDFSLFYTEREKERANSEKATLLKNIQNRCGIVTKVFTKSRWFL